MPVSVMASRRNCQVMSVLFAPMALRTPISRVRSVTLTSMMFITPTPPMSKPDGAEDDGGDSDFSDDAVKDFDFLVGGGDGEIILAVEGNIATAAKRFRGLIHGLVEHIGIGLHAKRDFVGGGKSFAEGAERD